MAWLVDNLSKHAQAFIGFSFLPKGASSGLRTEKDQTKKFLRRLTKELRKIQALKPGETYKKSKNIRVRRLQQKTSRGKEYVYEAGAYQVGYRPLPRWAQRTEFKSLTLKQAISLKDSVVEKVARQEVARPVSVGWKSKASFG